MFILATLFDIVGTAIGEAKISYKYLLAARIVQGFSTSAFESLIVAAVGDLYFVHERGLRIAIINFVLNAASSLASIICGQVFQNLGYLWLFHLFQIFLCIQFVLMFFFCPETTYIRDDRYNTDTVKEEKLPRVKHMSQDANIESTDAEKATDAQLTQTQTPSGPIPPKKTFVQELAIFTGVYSRDNMIKFLLGPFLTLVNPAACYAVITSGLLNSWYVGSAIILSGVFSGPPWHYDAAQIGYLGAGPFIGGMIGSILVSVASDPVIKYMTRLNKGT